MITRRTFLLGTAGAAALLATGKSLAERYPISFRVRNYCTGPVVVCPPETDRERFERLMKPGAVITGQEFVLTDGLPLVIDKACTVMCCKFTWRGEQVRGPCLVMDGEGPMTLYGISVINETEPHDKAVGLYFKRGHSTLSGLTIKKGARFT